MKMGESGKHVWQHGKTKTDPALRAIYLLKAVHFMKAKIDVGYQWKNIPVDPMTFIESPYFLGNEETYPKVKIEVEKLLTGDYGEAVLTGGIGCAKTTIALIAIAYTLYELSCMVKPHAAFDLTSSSEILFIFQSLKKELSKTVDYNRFKAILDNSPFFDREFRYDRAITSELRFPHRIIVKPLSGDASSAIGQNVFGGVIDEVNFMAITENSAQAGADGGTFDQAQAIYNSIARRRESRFMNQGKMPGLLCCVSSKRYPGEFTDRKMQEAEREIARTGKTKIFIYDKRAWEVKELSKFSGKWFKLFLGDANRKPRILREGEESLFSANDNKLIMDIPLEYTEQFESDILNSIRDIAGHSTLALHPFIMNTEALASTFGRVQSIVSRDFCDFDEYGLRVYPKRIINPGALRWCHIDPSVTGDSTGVAVGHVSGFTKVKRGEEVEILPNIVFDLLLEVRPPRGGEIELANVRRLLYKLRDLGMPLKFVTLDSHQSTDTIQTLMRNGFKSGYQSTDTDITPYELSKLAIYDGRVSCPEHDHAKLEWARLERNTQKNKIDHPDKGSKDVSDAMAGVIYGLTMRREIWTSHGISLNHIPRSLLELKKPNHKGSVQNRELKEGTAV